MKNFTKQITNKTLFKPTRWLLVALMLLLGTGSAWAVNLQGGEILYFKPNDNWKKEGARFAMFLCNGSSGDIWISMTSSVAGYYQAEVPAGDYKNIIFCRMNGGNSTNNWSNKWNQTADLTFDGTKDIFVLASNAAWDGASATWYATTKSYVLSGSFNDWGSSSFPAELELTASTEYTFKVKYVVSYESTELASIWYGNDGTMQRCGDSVETGGWTMTTDGNNCTIKADIDGSYTFNFDEQSKKVTVAYPDLSLDFTIDGPADICEQTGKSSHQYELVDLPTVTQTYKWENNLTGANPSAATGTTYSFDTGATNEQSGTITVTATYGLCKTTKEYSIKQWDKISNATISGVNTIKVDETSQLSANIAGGEWSSENTTIATISNDGLVTGIKEGTTVIKYIIENKGCGDAVSDYTITIEKTCDAPNSVTIDDAPEVKPCPGDKVTLTSTVSGGTGDIEYLWSVSGTDWSIENDANTNSSCTFVVGTENGTISLSATQCSTEIEATDVTIDVKSKLTKSDYTLQESANYTGNPITPTIQPGSGIPDPTTVRYGASAETATTTAPTEVGSYNVYISYISTDATDSYCDATDLEIGTFEIVCTDPAAFEIEIDNTAICSGGNATITIPDNHEAESYTWCTKNGDDYGAETTITDKSFTVSATGNYVVRAYNSTCMTESNAVTLTVDNTITNMFIGLVNQNGSYYETNPLPLCDNQVTLKAWATGAKTYKVYKTSDLNNFVQTGTVNGNGETNAISYTISKSNLSEGEHGYQVKFENTCGTTTTDTKTVTVPPTPTVPTLPTQGEKFKRQSCTDHLQHVNGFAGDASKMNYMAVLYEGENVTPTQPTDGTTYDITTNNKIGTGTVKVIQNGNSLAINELDPQKIYTLAIYRYNTACYEYSEPLRVTIDKNVPTLGELTINGNEFSVPVTKIGANESGVDLKVMKFQYYNEAGGNWADFGNTATYSLQDKTQAGGVITATINPGALTQGQTYQVRACVTNNSCSDLNKYAAFNTNNEITYTVPCSTVPKPQLTNKESSVCKSDTEKVNLNTLAGVNNVNWYKGNNKVADPTQVAITTEGTTTYVVKAVNGLCESEGVEFTLTVNPLPTITEISGNNSAVLNQEVELTATGNNIASVAWSANPGSITPNPDDSKKAILTHSTADAVTVTATATSEDGCTSTAATKTVTFDEEDCESTTTTVTREVIDEDKMEIWCREETGSNVGANLECYAWDNNQTLIFGSWNGQTTSTTKTYDGKTYRVWEINNITSNYTLPIKVIFSYQDGNSIYQTDDLETGDAGHKYTYWFKKDGDGNSNKGKKETVFEKGDGYDDSEIKKTITTTTTTPAPLSAPAVNTVSVTSQVGSGVVNFTGQVVKTGCAANNKIYVGYQYKLATDEWPTTGIEDADQAGANPLKLNPLGHPNGDNSFTANITLADGVYDFRAYVINGYDFTNGNYDQGVYYGLSKRVTVSIQQEAINTVNIYHADIDGNTINEPTYCAGTTAYIKLDHDGTPYKGDVVWTSTANHDFSKVEGNLFSYTVKGEDNVTASVKNDENDDYVSSNTLNIKVYPVPNMPNFTISKTAICSTDDDGAVITVTNPVVGITYQVYRKDGGTETAHGNAVTYNNGDLTINSIKTAGTYFVKAWNEECDNKVERSLTEAEVTIVDAAANSIAITPTSKEVNPWMPTTFIVTKTGSYNYTLTCAQVGSATVSSENVNIEYNYSFVPTNDGVLVTFTWTNMTDITGAVAPYLQDKTDGGWDEPQGTGNSVSKRITPNNAEGKVIVAAKFAFSEGLATTSDYTYTNQGDAPASDAIITKKGDTYIIKFPKPADAQIVDGQVTFNPIQYNVTAKLNVDVQGCGTTVATSNVTLTPLTEVCP